MELLSPFEISSRLLPAVRIADAVISIEYGPIFPDGRQVYHYHIDGPYFTCSGADIKSGCDGGTLQEGMATLLSFLSACAGSRGGENWDLFPEAVAEWATQHEDEIAMMQLTVAETPNLIIE